jgi:hypothetical protein
LNQKRFFLEKNLFIFFEKWDVQDEIILRFESKKILFRKASFYFLWKMRRSRWDNTEIWIRKDSFSKEIFLFPFYVEIFKTRWYLESKSLISSQGDSIHHHSIHLKATAFIITLFISLTILTFLTFLTFLIFLIHLLLYSCWNGNSLTSLNWWLRLGEKTIYRISESDDVIPTWCHLNTSLRAWSDCPCIALCACFDCVRQWLIVASLNSQSPLRSYASWVNEKSTIDACSVLDWLSPLGCCSSRVIDDDLDESMSINVDFWLRAWIRLLITISESQGVFVSYKSVFLWHRWSE